MGSSSRFIQHNFFGHFGTQKSGFFSAYDLCSRLVGNEWMEKGRERIAMADMTYGSRNLPYYTQIRNRTQPMLPLLHGETLPSTLL